VTNTAPKRRSYNKTLVAIAGALILLLAGGLLFYQRDHEITLPIAVRFTEIPDKLLVVGNAPVLEARLKGPPMLLKNLKDSQLTYEIDLGSAKPGPLFLKLAPEKIELPRRVSLLKFDPDSLTLTLDNRGEKLVPVVPDLSNDPAPGYIISKVVTSPSLIQLIGPASMLEKISTVRTTPIDLRGLMESNKKRGALRVTPHPYVKGVGDILVEVEIVVKEKIVEEWMHIHVQAKGANHRYEIKPNLIELLVRGPVNTIKKLAQGDGIQVYVSINGLKPGTYLRPAVIEPPLNTTLVEARPEVFTVKLFE